MQSTGQGNGPGEGGQVTEAGIDASGCVLWRWQVHKPPGSFFQPTRIALCSKVYAGDCVAAGNTGRRKTHPPEMTQRKSSKMLFSHYCLPSCPCPR